MTIPVKTMSRAGRIIPAAIERQIDTRSRALYPDQQPQASAFRSGALAAYVGHEATAITDSDIGKALEAGQRYGAHLAAGYGYCPECDTYLSPGGRGHYRDCAAVN